MHKQSCHQHFLVFEFQWGYKFIDVVKFLSRLHNIFSCRTKSAAALGTTFGLLLLLLLLLLLSVISKFIINSISIDCNCSRFCLVLALLSVSIA